MDPNNEITNKSIPYLRVHKSGRVERFFGTEVVPASLDPLTGVLSKDILIALDTGVSVRLYLPKPILDEPLKKLPVLVYFHGGGFCLCNAFNPSFHIYLNSLVAQSNIIAVSVDYRLAPEHPIPTPYDDSWAALKWVASHAAGGAGSEEWLSEHADLRRIFLAGESAGANIAHNMALRAGNERLEGGAMTSGIVLIHPYFLGTNGVESEMIDPVTTAVMHKMWKMACPSTTGSDDPWINPLADDAPSLSELACERVLVCVAGEDVLRDRGRDYYKRLMGMSGWGGEVELFESDGEGHVFHFYKPTSDQALALDKKICRFLGLN